MRCWGWGGIQDGGTTGQGLVAGKQWCGKIFRRPHWPRPGGHPCPCQRDLHADLGPHRPLAHWICKDCVKQACKTAKAAEGSRAARQLCTPSHLGPDTLQGMGMHSPGQQLLWLLNKVAVEALGAFLFFFLLHFIEIIMVRCQTFLNAQKSLPSGSFV